MRLKDYLRGLGMGMIVVVLILAIAGGDRTMTDEEIIARARQLGMVDGNQTLTNIKDKEPYEDSVTVESVEEATDTAEDTKESSEPEETGEVTESSDTEETEETTKSSEAEETEETTKSSEAEEMEETTESLEAEKSEENETSVAGSASEEKITITVQRGDSSVSVSKDLAEAGAVESAKDFDRYLCENGYDKKISIGTFQITLGATYEEIAKIITKSK